MKDKIISVFNQFNIPVIAFTAYMVRIIVSGASIGDSIALFAVTGMYGYHKFINHKNNLWSRAVENEIRDLKTAVESVKHRTGVKEMYERKERPAIRKF